MGAVYFYHLKQSGIPETLRKLFVPAQARGWRILVRGQDPQRMQALDENLWLGPDDAFLAHGLAGGAHDAMQPILLSHAGPSDPPLSDDPECVMSIDGAAVTAAEIRARARVCILFDGHDMMAEDHARKQWVALVAEGVEAQYWSDESGRWELKAKKAAAEDTGAGNGNGNGADAV